MMDRKRVDGQTVSNSTANVMFLNVKRRKRKERERQKEREKGERGKARKHHNNKRSVKTKSRWYGYTIR